MYLTTIEKKGNALHYHRAAFFAFVHTLCLVRLHFG